MDVGTKGQAQPLVHGWHQEIGRIRPCDCSLGGLGLGGVVFFDICNDQDFV